MAKFPDGYVIFVHTKPRFDDDKVVIDICCEEKELVTCNNCKHGQSEEWDNGECVDKTVCCDKYGIHKPDWFCGDGERREE